MGSAGSIKTCFITAPPGLPLEALRDSLLARGIRLVAPHDLRSGSSWPSATPRELAEADLVIGVLTWKRQSQWVLFELGQAWALNRRILLISAPKAGPIPGFLQGITVIRTSPRNREAIDFALDQLLSAPAPPSHASQPSGPTTKGLGAGVDVLLAELDRAVASEDYQALQQLTSQALRSSGADIVVASQKRDVGADLAVWSDLLEPSVGNPLLIEIKAHLRGSSETKRAVQKLAAYAAAAGTTWALLLYADGLPQEGVGSGALPTVLVLSLRTLLEALRLRTFPEVIRDLRNQRVHGIRP